MKKILLLLAILMSTTTLMAQEFVPEIPNYDTTPYVGTWQAKDGNMAYEIECVKGIFEMPWGDKTVDINQIIGTFKYIKNGKTIRLLKKSDDFHFWSSGFDPGTALLIYTDNINKWQLYVKFKLDDKDPNKAYWSYTIVSKMMGHNQTPADLPKELVFYKQK